MKSSVAVKSIPGATTKGMKHHIKGCLEDNSPDSIILHVGTDNLKNKESVEDIAKWHNECCNIYKEWKKQGICVWTNCPKW